MGFRDFFKGAGKFLAGGTAAAAGSIAQSAGSFVAQRQQLEQIRAQNEPEVAANKIAALAQQEDALWKRAQTSYTNAQADAIKNKTPKEIAALEAQAALDRATASSYSAKLAHEKLLQERKIEFEKEESDRDYEKLTNLEKLKNYHVRLASVANAEVESKMRQDERSADLIRSAAGVAGQAFMGGMGDKAIEAAETVLQAGKGAVVEDTTSPVINTQRQELLNNPPDVSLPPRGGAAPTTTATPSVELTKQAFHAAASAGDIHALEKMGVTEAEIDEYIASKGKTFPARFK